MARTQVAVGRDERVAWSARRVPDQDTSVDVLRHLPEPMPTTRPAARCGAGSGASAADRRRRPVGRLDFPTVGRRLADLATPAWAPPWTSRRRCRSASSGWASSAEANSTTPATSTSCSSTTVTLATPSPSPAGSSRSCRSPPRTGSCSAPTPSCVPRAVPAACHARSTGTPRWYERFARPWEFQALIKARPVAGDASLGAAFMALTRPFVWPDVLDPDAVREVRALKARAEAEVRRRGLSDRELKRGRGGIRDVEFAVQLLQLVHGRADPEVRSTTTLDALTSSPTAGTSRPRTPGSSRRLHVPAHRRAPLAAPRRTADPHRARRHRRPDAAGPGARLPRSTRGERRRGVRSRPAAPADRRAGHPRAAVLRSDPRHPRRDGPPERRRGRGAPHRVRVRRRRPHPPGAARADPRAHPHLPDPAAAPAGHPRLALRVARPRPRAVAAAATGRRPHPGDDARDDVPRSTRRRGANLPGARLESHPRRHAPPPARGGRAPRRRRLARARARRGDELRRAALATLGWRQDTPARRAGLRRFKRRECSASRPATSQDSRRST